MLFDKSKVKKVYMGRLENQDDLLEKISEFINKKKIKKGFISIVGAVSEATIGYYDQIKKEYKSKTIKKSMEIVSATGNISINNNEPFPHIHIVLADKTLNTVAGHLFPGTKIFAAEFTIIEFTGKDLIRKPDAITKLNLWG